jgi:uncharacterized protein YbaP (TraB family)
MGPGEEASPMNFVVIGTDHRMQHSDSGLEGLMRAWLTKNYIESLKGVAEEYSEKIGASIAQRLAHERNLHWYNIDMTMDEKRNAGILEEQENRPSEKGIAFRVPSDEVREDAWTNKLMSSSSGTTLVICGYLHFNSLVAKLRKKGHAVDQRVYLETVPEIKQIERTAQKG